jgi:hypothetical protein
MAKHLVISLIFLLFLTGKPDAQNIRRDSLIKLAKADAKNFRLSETDLTRFRIDRRDYMTKLHNPLKAFDKNYQADMLQHPADYMSDFFKPTKADVSDATLLSDSGYVRAFRDAAYNKTLKRRTAGHYVAVYGSIFTGVAAFVALLVALSNFH